MMRRLSEGPRPRFFRDTMPGGRVGEALIAAQDWTPLILWPVTYFPLAMLMLLVVMCWGLIWPGASRE